MKCHLLLANTNYTNLLSPPVRFGFLNICYYVYPSKDTEHLAREPEHASHPYGMTYLRRICRCRGPRPAFQCTFHHSGKGCWRILQCPFGKCCLHSQLRNSSHHRNTSPHFCMRPGLCPGKRNQVDLQLVEYGQHSHHLCSLYGTFLLFRCMCSVQHTSSCRHRRRPWSLAKPKSCHWRGSHSELQ